MALNVPAYVLAKNKVKSLATGVKKVRFDEDGNLEVTLNDDSIIKRPFKDIKDVEFREVINKETLETEKHLFVIYSDDSKEDVGIIESKFDIDDFITLVHLKMKRKLLPHFSSTQMKKILEITWLIIKTSMISGIIRR